MKYFETIKKSKGNGKNWKPQHKLKCSYCGKEINPKEDHITLSLYWKIKGKEDVKYFCRLKCLEAWLKQVEK